jgi:predicted DNA-binding transcriptional regulator AlpA
MNRRLASRVATAPRRGLNRDESAAFVGISTGSFDRMVVDGRLPQPIELDGELVWDLVQLDRAFDRLTGLRRSTL